MLVAGDIGGTKSDLAIFSGEAGVHAPLAQDRLHSADYPRLQSMVKQFLAKADKPVDSACFAVAGPVIRPGLGWFRFSSRIRATREACE